MDSDEGGHSESEFYYPEEETSNQITPINRDELEQDGHLVVNNAKGNRPQAARELTEDEEELLFETGQFGEDDPEVLQRTVRWVLSLHFGFRARDECRRLQWDDIAVEDDPVSGKQVLVWKAKRGSKTRQGDGHCRAFSPKAHATNTKRCPVRLYLKFASHRPDEVKKPDAPFFLAVNHGRALTTRSGTIEHLV